MIVGVMSMPVLIVGMLLLTVRCSGQSDSIRSPRAGGATLFTTVSDDGGTALKGAGHVLVAPASWRTEDWFIAGGIVGATAVSFALDEKAFELMKRNESAFNDHATSIAVEYGSGAVAIGLPAALYLTGSS